MDSDETLFRARDLMERDVITVTPETRILDVHRLLIEEEIHGAPVVGEDGIVCGVVSSLDLLRVVRDELEPGAGAAMTAYLSNDQEYSSPDWIETPDDLQDRMQGLTVADAMTREIVTIGPDATVAEIARMMLVHHVHRLLVVEDRVLQGVITTFDLLRAASRGVVPGPTRHTGYRRAVQ